MNPYAKYLQTVGILKDLQISVMYTLQPVHSLCGKTDVVVGEMLGSKTVCEGFKLSLFNTIAKLCYG
jgi:hypothetical protein